MNVEKKLRSRKLWVAVATAALVAFGEQLGVGRKESDQLVQLAMVYLGMQGLVDVAKKRR